MSSRTFDLNTMTVEDLFRAKHERRQRLARLPFEQKIEIVRNLQAVSRAARTARHEDQHKGSSETNGK